MRENMHHHIKNNRRCRLTASDIRSQLHNTVRLSPHQSHRSGIIQCKSGNSQFINFPKWNRCSLFSIPDDNVPGKGIEQINDNP